MRSLVLLWGLPDTVDSSSGRTSPLMTDIDPYPVSELQSWYNIGKQAVYNRLDALDTKLICIGRAIAADYGNAEPAVDD